MEKAVQTFIEGKRIAVVGMSRSGGKFGNLAAKELKERGYQVFPVHPQAQEIGGLPCSSSLAALQGKVDGVLVSVPAQKAETVLNEAAQAGLKNVWLQQGAETEELKALGERLGLNLVAGKCILMYAQPVRSFHAWHRGFVRLIGRL